MPSQHQPKEHILVCLSPSPSTGRVILAAANMAHAFNATLTALFVRTPGYESMSKKDKDQLRANTAYAKNRGAAIETVPGEDTAEQIAEYARISGVTKIVIGESSFLRRLPWQKPTIPERLSQLSPGLNIYIIPGIIQESAYAPEKAPKKLDLATITKDWAFSIFIILLVTLISFPLFQFGFTESNIMAVYLLGILVSATVTSTKSSYVLSAIGSVLIFNYYFSTPRFSLVINTQDYPIPFFIMLLSALFVGTMTERIKSHAQSSARTAYRTNLLLETNQLIQKAESEGEILQAVWIQTSKLLQLPVVVLPGEIENQQPGTQHFPIKLRQTHFATLILQSEYTLDPFEQNLLTSILGECALALENRRSIQEMENAMIRAENEKIRSNLLRTISHDLRTPLTSIYGNADILSKEASALDPETIHQMYQDIREDSEWLIELVENLLAVTRFEEGRAKLNRAPHLADELLSEATSHIHRRQKSHNIITDSQDDLLLVSCDGRLVIQVLVNLMDNAVKYTPAGSTIHVSTYSENGTVSFRVSDNGPGICDDEKEKVFQMFYIGSNPVADNRRSLGLGLGLCRSIAEAHGGQLTLTDNTPSGAVFTFTIPIGEVEIHA